MKATATPTTRNLAARHKIRFRIPVFAYSSFSFSTRLFLSTMAKKSPKGLSSFAGGKKKKKAFGGKGSDEAGSGGGGGLGVSKGSPAFSAPRTSVRATTHKGRRVLAARESQLVEELKNTLLLFGKRTSQLVKVRLVEADGGGGSRLEMSLR